MVHHSCFPLQQETHTYKVQSSIHKAMRAQQPDLAQCKDGAHEAAVVGAQRFQGKVSAKVGPHERAQHAQSTTHSTVARNRHSEVV